MTMRRAAVGGGRNRGIWDGFLLTVPHDPDP